MIRFIIVEDEIAHRKSIKEMITSTMMQNKEDFDIKEFNDCTQELFKFIDNNYYENIYILDFELPLGNALDIARRIRNEDWTSQIIVFSSHSNLALETFKQRLQILDFIGKFTEGKPKFIDALNLAINITNKGKMYKFTSNYVDYSIPYEKILYFTRKDRKVSIITDTEEHYQYKSIKEISEILPKYFVTSSKGIILNMKRVKELDWTDNSVVFDNNQKEYIISKTHRSDLKSYATK